MKKTWFDVRLYMDGLKQLKLMGLLFTIVTTVVAVITPIMEQLDYLSYRYDYIGADRSAQTVTAFEMNPLLILLFCAFAPLMTLFLFSFLNKREASDFYHAITATRPCLFFSFFAAVMTWAAVILLVSNTISLITFAALPHLFLINVKGLLLYSFNAFAGAWLIAAGVAIATALSGTVVVNLLIALILIFFPRIFLLMVVKGIESSFPLVEGLDFLPLLGTHYNVPVGFIFGVFNGDWDLSLGQWQSGVYTLVVALLYTAAAAWLFVRRRSEAAGHSAPSKKLQSLFRFLVGFVISSVATYGLYSMLTDIHYSWDLTDLGSLFLVYGTAVFAFLVFEVFCTRKFRGLLRKGAVTLLWLIVANVTLLGAMYGLGRSLYLYKPSAEDIQSVRIVSGMDVNYYSLSYSSTRNYFSSQVSEIELKDPAINKIVSEQLEHTVGLLEISQGLYYQEREQASLLTVAINSGGITRYRRIYLYKDDVAALTDLLYQNEAYRNVYTSLPDTVSGFDVVGDKQMWMNFKNAEEEKAFYEVLKKEFNALGFETQYKLTSALSSEGDPLCNLYFRFSKGGKWYEFDLPLYEQLMPKTTRTLVNLCNNTTNANEGLKVLADEAYELNWLELQCYKDGKVSPMRYFKLQDNPALQAQVADWLQQLKNANATHNIDTGKPFFYVCGSLDREVDEYKEHYIHTEENYAYVAALNGELPTWLLEYIANELAIALEDVTDQWIFG